MTEVDAMLRLHPAVRTVWLLGLVAWSLPLAIASLFYDLVRYFGDRPGLLPPGVLTLLVLVVSILTIVFLPRLRYRFWFYSLQGEEVRLERGIWNRMWTVVPLRRVQHLDVTQSLLEREFGLAKLVMHTAGTHSSEVSIPGLLLPEAERLRDEIKAYIIEETA